MVAQPTHCSVTMSRLNLFSLFNLLFLVTALAATGQTKEKPPAPDPATQAPEKESTHICLRFLFDSLG